MPLIDLLKKDQAWGWAKRQQLAFDKIKASIISEAVLTLSNFEEPLKFRRMHWTRLLVESLFKMRALWLLRVERSKI